MSDAAKAFVILCSILLCVGLAGGLGVGGWWNAQYTTDEIRMVQPNGILPGRDAQYAGQVNVPNSEANLNNAQAELANAQATSAIIDAQTRVIEARKADLSPVSPLLGILCCGAGIMALLVAGVAVTSWVERDTGNPI